MIRLLDIINKTKSLNILEKFSKVKKVLTLRKYLGPKFSGCFFSKFKKKETVTEVKKGKK